MKSVHTPVKVEQLFDHNPEIGQSYLCGSIRERFGRIGMNLKKEAVHTGGNRCKGKRHHILPFSA